LLRPSLHLGKMSAIYQKPVILSASEGGRGIST
jgi:hypothetical protein